VREESPFDGYVLKSPVCVLKNFKWIVVIHKSFSVLRTALGVLWSFSTLCLKKDIHSFFQGLGHLKPKLCAGLYDEKCLVIVQRTVIDTILY